MIHPRHFLPLCLSAVVSAAPCWAQPELSPSEVERKVENLLGQMTLDEKIGQLTLTPLGPEYSHDLVRSGRIGAVIGFNDAKLTGPVQQAAKDSRLKIPVLIGLDILHGFRTVFPMPLAEAATWNPPLARLASEWSAKEASAAGINWTFAPMIDLTRDVRWGRGIEGSGEDVTLAKAFAAARVEGFRAGGLATTAKHFAAYGASTGGRDYDAASVSPAELRDIYLPPFRSAVDAGTDSVMAALTVLDGMPAAADPDLLTGVLRKEWGFDGFVVSDWTGIDGLREHGIAGDGIEAARKAFLAGVDMDMSSGLYSRHLADEVAAGRVPLERVDEGVRRVLRVKVRLGLFERPIADFENQLRSVVTPEARQASYEVARESLVLLTNRDAVLPLRADRKIAVIGPFATSAGDQLGPHDARGHGPEAVTILDAMRKRAAVSGNVLLHAPGCDVACASADGFAAALETARAADTIVAVMGEPRDSSGEAASRAHLTLWGRQQDLLDALIATGKPVVLVLVAGRPMELGSAAETLAGVLMTWYPGTEGGRAVAETLFGDVNPSGKLPLTWPRSVGQVPIHYDQLPSGRPTSDLRYSLKYIDTGMEPLYPFGWGLSYTRFAYSDLTVTTPELRASETAEVRVTVKNTGTQAGQEAVQLYVRDPVASRSRPVRQLKAFTKVALAPGEARTVTLNVPARDLGFHRGDGTYVVEPGAFRVFVGGSSLAGLETAFTVTDGLTVPPR